MGHGAAFLQNTAETDRFYLRNNRQNLVATEGVEPSTSSF